MENASKALLIAAAVLVAILLITIGIKIFSSSSETGKIAMQTGDTISSKTGEATDFAISQITGKSAQGGSDSNTSSQNIGKVITIENYGDYIDLGKSVEGIGTTSSADDWRILYNDTSGHVYAILADYLPNTDPSVASSGLSTTGTYGVFSSKSRADLLKRLRNTTVWQSLISDKLRSICQVKGATTAEIILASYNKKHGTNLEIYDFPTFRINSNDESSSIDTLYMPHPGATFYEGCHGYRLETPSSAISSFLWRVNSYGSLDQDSYISGIIGVRPVVSLPSNIQVTKNGTVWTVVQ